MHSNEAGAKQRLAAREAAEQAYALQNAAFKVRLGECIHWNRRQCQAGVTRSNAS